MLFRSASSLGVRFARSGRGATATLVVDGEAVGSVDVPFAMFIMSSIGPSVGYDHGSAVSERYDAPFAFEGTLHRVDIQLAARRSRKGDAADERAAMAQQ